MKPSKNRSRDQDAAEKAIKKALAAIRKPTEVKGVDWEFGEDSTGDPAVWIFLKLDHDDPSPEAVKKLSDYVSALTHKILDQDTEYWPFVRFKVAA